jgi:hypothetical protein
MGGKLIKEVEIKGFQELLTKERKHGRESCNTT